MKPQNKKNKDNMYDDDLFLDDKNMGGFNDFGSGDEYNYDWRPQQMDENTFKLRNDPSNILYEFRLELMGAYEIKEKVRDEETGEEKTIVKIKFKKNIKPIANKQGVEEIITYLRKFINNHTVQANLTTMEEYNKRLKIISNNIVVHFLSNRKNWDVSIEHIDPLITYCIELIDMFYTRTLMDKERSHYGESYKDTTHREFRPQEKVSAFQKLASFLGGGKGKW